MNELPKKWAKYTLLFQKLQTHFPIVQWTEQDYEHCLVITIDNGMKSSKQKRQIVNLTGYCHGPKATGHHIPDPYNPGKHKFIFDETDLQYFESTWTEKEIDALIKELKSFL